MRKFVKLGVLAIGLVATPLKAQNAETPTKICLSTGVVLPVFEPCPPPPETRIGEKDFASPPATLDQLDWLVGQWAGEGIQGAPAMESWLPPAGGTMVGTFVQEREDEDGPMKIMFTEHMYISEENGSLALKLKHFNADMTGWEEKDDFLTFRLVAIEECAAYFNALTLRCLDRDEPGSGIVAAVRMKSDKPEPQELIFRFDRVVPSAPTQSGSCMNVTTTLDLNECLGKQLARANETYERYYAVADERFKDRPALRVKMAQSYLAFIAYRDAECEAIYERWKDGTIRGAMILGCKIKMTDARTHEVWANWLSFMDSTPPLLPEPEPTR